MGARDGTYECSVEFGGQRGAVAQGNEVDVFAEATVGEMGACERGAADEVHTVGESIRNRSEQMRYEVVTLNLFRRDPEPGGNSVTFVEVHGCTPAHISARRNAATRR